MADVVSHYDASAPTYTGQYDESKLLTSPDYLASFFRLKKVRQRALDLGLTSIYELGIGDGTPLVAMAEAGLRVAGSDFSEGMLTVARAQFADKGLDPSVLDMDPDGPSPNGASASAAPAAAAVVDTPGWTGRSQAPAPRLFLSSVFE